MPDTGAPWNIPYVESTDLVSDWPADSLALANAIDAGLDAAGNAGIGSNVVQAVKTDRFTTTSGSLTDITGFTLTITPTSTSSKILVLYSFTFHITSNDTAEFQLVRDSTNIGVSTGANITNQTEVDYVALNAPRVTRHAGQFLDSPATTSATTYKMRMRMTGGTGAIGGDANRGAIATITAIEVAA